MWELVRHEQGRFSRGQSTIEYLLVFVAFIALAVALASVWRAGSEGSLLGYSIRASSHLVGEGLAPALQDVLLY